MKNQTMKSNSNSNFNESKKMIITKTSAGNIFTNYFQEINRQNKLIFVISFTGKRIYSISPDGNGNFFAVLNSKDKFRNVKTLSSSEKVVIGSNETITVSMPEKVKKTKTVIKTKNTFAIALSKDSKFGNKIYMQKNGEFDTAISTVKTYSTLNGAEKFVSNNFALGEVKVVSFVG